MQPNEQAQVVFNALNQILNRLTVFADGLVMARKLVANLEAENAELQRELDELRRKAQVNKFNGTNELAKDILKNDE